MGGKELWSNESVSMSSSQKRRVEILAIQTILQQTGKHGNVFHKMSTLVSLHSVDNKIITDNSGYIIQIALLLTHL